MNTMKRKFLLLMALIACICTFGHNKEMVEYVNPLIGTALKGEGGTVPYVGTPFAMTSFLPQTRENKMGTMAYVYDDGHIMGFLGSHQPTIWMGDYGYVSVMPQVGEGEARVLPQERKMSFSHKDEKAAPHYYSVTLTDNERNRISAEMTASSRCALLNFRFPKNKVPRLIIQGINLNSELNDWCNHYDHRLKTIKGWVKIDKERNEIVGYNPDRQSSQLGPELPNFKGYFIIRFNSDINEFGCWSDSTLYPQQTELHGTRMGAYIDFRKNDREVKVQLATSFISLDQARINLEKEVPDWDFQRLCEKTKQAWNDKLSRFTLKGVSEDEARIFYTALYHSYLFPREFSEYGKYYSAFDDRIHEGFSYNDYSLWDTFRAFHPLMTLLEPKLTGDWITSLLQMYKEGGWIPMWPNPSYTNIMIGTHADAVIADAYMKGIRNYDTNLAYEAMRKDAMVPPDCDTQRNYGDRNYWSSFEGRAGASYYHSIGYVPDDKTAESVSRTLEYAYDDWCIAQVAKEMGKEEDYKRLMQFSQNYKNLYHVSKGFFLPRNYDGTWIDLDDHSRQGLTEGSKWTYLFCVLQDIPGMIEMMGGEDKFSEKLDQNFEGNHYRHDNEPGHHYVYLYNYCGKPWKTQELVRKHVRENYKNAPDGVNGNDDCGQMSAWYLFSVMGFYPVTPGSNEFAIGAPQFPEITLRLQDHDLTIKAENLSEDNKYVQSVFLDGKKVLTPFLNYFDLIRAKEIRFMMGNQVPAVSPNAQEYPKLILPGDYPDPSILRDGEDYYMTHSPFYYKPGLLIWHSKDLISWEPVCRALPEFEGSAWAPDLIKYKDTYYIYYPSAGTNWVVWAKDIKGPWSKPVDLKVGGIDPGHIADENGNRYLYVNDGAVIRLTADGLSTVGEKMKVYDGWKYPDTWETECMCLEAPKLNYHNGYYYLISAQGGTAGPATSHMVVSARSKNITGPWENSPYNPIVHTYSGTEDWWSKGHGTLVDDVNGNWWIFYHAYAKGFHTLGRSTLMEPVEWTEDGWFRTKATATPIMSKQQIKHGLELSDSFMGPELGLQWTFWKQYDPQALRFEQGTLWMDAYGETPADGRKLLVDVGDKQYEAEVTINVGEGNTAGLVLFYNEKAYAGVTSDGKTFTVYLNVDKKVELPNRFGKHFIVRMRNDGNSMAINVSKDGKKWTLLMDGLDVSILNHNNFGEFCSLRVGLLSAGGGSAGFSRFCYRNTFVGSFS